MILQKEPSCDKTVPEAERDFYYKSIVGRLKIICFYKSTVNRPLLLSPSNGE